MWLIIELREIEGWITWELVRVGRGNEIEHLIIIVVIVEGLILIRWEEEVLVLVLVLALKLIFILVLIIVLTLGQALVLIEHIVPRRWHLDILIIRTNVICWSDRSCRSPCSILPLSSGDRLYLNLRHGVSIEDRSFSGTTP